MLKATRVGRTFRRMTAEVHRREEELKRCIAELDKGSRGGGGSG